MLTTNNSDNLIKGVMIHGPDILEKCLANPADIKKYLEILEKEHLDYPIPPTNIDLKNWLIPNDYKIMDIEEFLVNQCPTENYDRLIRELELYRKNDMISMLKTMKYIVDTLRSNNVIWGVGRGSSVASYVLYLIGVHKIDSVKYSLPIEEFFKEI
jgi:DNA polymerase III alpha subunit